MTASKSGSKLSAGLQMFKSETNLKLIMSTLTIVMTKIFTSFRRMNVISDFSRRDIVVFVVSVVIRVSDK